MPTTPPPAPLSEADYGAIESAVMETARGRWFLAEYARRNRSADTTMLLTALDRIESALRGERSVQSVDQIRFDLVEMAKAIARTKAEIAAIKPDAEHHGKFGDATEELDAIVQATESATSDILAAAEQIQEIAWTMREQGSESEVCDLLDAKATDVYTACSFQDLTGQRTRKVIQVMRYLEGRINAMINIWGLDGTMAAEAAEAERARVDAALLHGPALPGQGLGQTDVDVVMGPVEPVAAAPTPAAAPVAEPPAAMHALAPEVKAELEDAEFVSEVAAEAGRQFAAEPEPVAPPLQPAADTSRPAARPAPGDPLAAITALSYEEKIALFT
jgi:chemotaxis protein CheZ